MSIERSLLLVDDDREFVDILARRFFQLGFAVTALHHPRQAMEAASFKKFNVAVIDQGLPETAGLDLMEHLFQKQADLHVIILSGFADPSLKCEVQQSGAFEYLLKPCKLAELVSVVDRALHAVPTRGSRHQRNAELGQQPPDFAAFGTDRPTEQPVSSKAPETIHEYAG